MPLVTGDRAWCSWCQEETISMNFMSDESAVPLSVRCGKCAKERAGSQFVLKVRRTREQQSLHEQIDRES